LYKDKKIFSDALLKKLLPISEKSLLKTFELINETETSIDEFRKYFYKYISEDYEYIELKNGITGIFYWFVIEKITNSCSDYFNNLILDNILVEDDIEPPLFRLNDKLSKDQIKNFFDNLTFILSLIPQENKTILFNWFIKQIFADILYREYIFNNNEIYPNMIEKFKLNDFEVFKINYKKISSILRQDVKQLDIFCEINE
jgi:hypothetical protein